MQTFLLMIETLEAFMVGAKFINSYPRVTTLYRFQRKKDFLDSSSLKTLRQL